MTDLILIATTDRRGRLRVPFGAAGFTTAIPFDRARREEADALALSTESREVSFAEAERRVRPRLRPSSGETAPTGRPGSTRRWTPPCAVTRPKSWP